MVAELLVPNPPPRRKSPSIAMAKRGASGDAARSASKSGRLTEPTDVEHDFETPAASLEPQKKEPAKLAIKRRVAADSPTRPGPGRSSPPTMGEPMDGTPRRARARDLHGVSPPPGCSTDALRIHFEFVIKGFEHVLGNQAKEQTNAEARITKLESDLPDVRNELVSYIKDEHQEVVGEFLSLRGELSDFASRVEDVTQANIQAVERIKSIDRILKEHLDVAFACVEVKCESLTSAMEELGARVEAGKQHPQIVTPPGVPVHAMTPDRSVLSMEERLAKVEAFLTGAFATSCHCVHVRDLLDDHVDIKKQLIELRARGAPPLAPGGPGRLGPSSVTGDCPHCSHVDVLLAASDQLNARVTALETMAGRAVGASFAPAAAPERTPLIGGACPPGNGFSTAGAWNGVGLRTDDAHRRNFNEDSINWERLFDDKVALSSAYAYTGKNGEEWSVMTRGYFMTRLNGIGALLNWVENREHSEVTQEALDEAKRDGHFIDLEGPDLPKISAKVWQFLNHCVSGDARHTFRGADQLNGLEAWRLLIIDFRKGIWFRKEHLRRLTKDVPAIAKLEDVAQAVSLYDQNVRDYETVTHKGKIDDDQRKSDLLQALPELIREQFQMRQALPESYKAFRDVLLNTTNTMLFQRGKMPRAVGAVDHEEPAKAEPDKTQEYDEGWYENMVAAFFRKGKGKGKGKGKLSMTEADRSPHGRDDARKPKCVQCGRDSHESKDCPSGFVSRERRPCWGCGKPGHVSANCPEGKGRSKSARMVDHGPADSDLVDFFGCVVEADSSKDAAEQVVTSKGKPMPTNVTLWDHVRKAMPVDLHNKFAALDSKEPENSKQPIGPHNVLTAGQLVHKEEPEKPLLACRGCCAESTAGPFTTRSDKRRQRRMTFQDSATLLEELDACCSRSEQCRIGSHHLNDRSDGNFCE